MKQSKPWALTIILFFFSMADAYAQAEFWNGGAIRVGTSTTVCDAAAEGAIRYSSSNTTVELCDGTTWGSLSKVGAPEATPPPGSGYLVLTESTWDGNLGGNAGADSKCLTELTTKTNWRGYSTAQTNGLLIAAKVRAFICTTTSSAGCANPKPSTTYVFATVGDPLAGGAMLTTDASSYGPGDSSNWAAVNYFGTNTKYWFGRAHNSGQSETLWSLSGGNGAGGCVGFTNNVNVDGAAARSGYTGAARYYSSSSNRTECATALRLICMVDP